MSAFLDVLKKLKEQDQEFVTVLGGREVPVKIKTIQDDWIVLVDDTNNQRYDLHTTSVIIVSTVQ
ncbi:conserved hypothetical protein [Nitrospina gracilis 3/211]|uniref:Uncharacterized protein n=1 Tax=Nitrospina gracilis (strain 3/211) TaxID=1266370 RepID=M1YXH4_NITG3|nr:MULTISPECIES: hypothetical protein [Nitrospina]MCF8722384.1 hypothetical protein [Nitrospina sp. Nb-3]CCQ89998.1 conserved hypothetical protein [Nitrospina gracilis 3/211]